jgi:hypothetical protein
MTCHQRHSAPGGALQELESRAAPVCWDDNGDHWHTVLETQGNSSALALARPCRAVTRQKPRRLISIISFLKKKNLNASLSAFNWQTKTQAELDRAAALMPLHWCGRGAVTTPLPLHRT